jgi:hypothetical protein
MADNKMEKIILPEVPVQESSPERIEVPASPEGLSENISDFRKGEKSKQELQKSSFRDALAKVSSLPKTGDSERQKKIDTILEDGLGEIFLKMPNVQQVTFKEEGERTVRKIDTLMSKAKVSAKKIFRLIKRWLAMIPGVNHFFLEQEAKIKTDRIMKINN